MCALLFLPSLINRQSCTKYPVVPTVVLEDLTHSLISQSRKHNSAPRHTAFIRPPLWTLEPGPWTPDYKTLLAPNHMETNQLPTSMPFSSLAGLVRGMNMQTSNFNSLLRTTACLQNILRKTCCSGCSFEVSCSFFPHSYFQWLSSILVHILQLYTDV